MEKEKGGLEKDLNQIRVLMKDLDAFIEKKHFKMAHSELEEVCVDGWHSSRRIRKRDELVPGYSFSTMEPDCEKREAAIQQLQQIYDFSEWYSAKYLAGVALCAGRHMEVVQLKEELKFWLEFLKRELFAEIILQREKGHVETRSDHNSRKIHGQGKKTVGEKVWVIDTPKIVKPDIERREKAKKDLEKLKKLKEELGRELRKIHRAQLEEKDWTRFNISCVTCLAVCAAAFAITYIFFELFILRR